MGFLGNRWIEDGDDGFAAEEAFAPSALPGGAGARDLIVDRAGFCLDEQRIVDRCANGDANTATPSNPPTTTATDYAKAWVFVVDGNPYATITFGTTGAITANTNTEFVNPLPNHHAVAREDTGIALGVVSPDYQPAQPAQLIGFMRDLSAQAPIVVESAGSFKRGAMTFI